MGDEWTHLEHKITSLAVGTCISVTGYISDQDGSKGSNAEIKSGRKVTYYEVTAIKTGTEGSTSI
jgi:hypothetical protein